MVTQEELNEGMWGALDYAYDNPQALFAWIDKGADVNARTYHPDCSGSSIDFYQEPSWTLLDVVISRDYFGGSSDDPRPIVSGLLDRGAEVSNAQHFLNKVVEWECVSRTANNKLLDDAIAIADINSASGLYDATPLDICLGGAGRSVEVARSLIERGAEVNATDKAGDTPLMTTCSMTGKNPLPLATLLIENGADPLVKNKSGLTALDIAHIEGDDELANYLQNVTCEQQAERLTRGIPKAQQEESEGESKVRWM